MPGEGRALSAHWGLSGPGVLEWPDVGRSLTPGFRLSPGLFLMVHWGIERSFRKETAPNHQAEGCRRCLLGPGEL